MAAKAAAKASGTAAIKERAKSLGMKVKDFRRAMEEAYDLGFQQGYAASERIPKVPGAKLAAQTGYGKGINANRKVKKYQAKARGGNSGGKER